MAESNLFKIILYIFKFFTVQLHLSPFLPITLPHPTHLHLPHSILPLHHCPFPWVLYTWSLMTLPSFPPIIPSHHPSGYCQFVLYFNVSRYILLACFVDWVTLIGEIIWYLSFAACLISLSIMLSSSICAVTKGRSSFFLSAV